MPPSSVNPGPVQSARDTSASRPPARRTGCGLCGAFGERALPGVAFRAAAVCGPGLKSACEIPILHLSAAAATVGRIQLQQQHDERHRGMSLDDDC